MVYSVFAVEVVGLLALGCLTGPWHRWLDDAGALSRRLRQVGRDGQPEQFELAMAEVRLKEFRQRTLFGRRTRLLKRLGLVRPTAAAEWRAEVDLSEQFQLTLLGQFSYTDLVRYSLIRPANQIVLVSGAVVLTCALLEALLVEHPWRPLVLGALQVGVWLLTLLPLRVNLALENRRLARQRVWIATCRRQLAELRTKTPQPERADRVVLQVGSWAVVRRR